VLADGSKARSRAAASASPRLALLPPQIACLELRDMEYALAKLSEEFASD